MWNIFVLISILVVIGLSIYNIWSLIRKMRANPQHWFDLSVGIFIWCLGIAALIVIFIRYL